MRIDANDQRICANLRINDVVYPELSYQLMGIFYRVHNRLGPHHPEKHYQKAIEIELKEAQVPFEREKFVPLGYQGELLGKYFVDFVVDSKIAIETKAINFFGKAEWHQARDYLKALNLKLAILVNFSTPRLSYKRVLNSQVKI